MAGSASSEHARVIVCTRPFRVSGMSGSAALYHSCMRMVCLQEEKQIFRAPRFGNFLCRNPRRRCPAFWGNPDAPAGGIEEIRLIPLAWKASCPALPSRRKPRGRSRLRPLRSTMRSPVCSGAGFCSSSRLRPQRRAWGRICFQDSSRSPPSCMRVCAICSPAPLSSCLLALYSSLYRQRDADGQVSEKT